VNTPAASRLSCLVSCAVLALRSSSPQVPVVDAGVDTGGLSPPIDAPVEDGGGAVHDPQGGHAERGRRERRRL